MLLYVKLSILKILKFENRIYCYPYCLLPVINLTNNMLSDELTTTVNNKSTRELLNDMKYYFNDMKYYLESNNQIRRLIELQKEAIHQKENTIEQLREETCQLEDEIQKKNIENEKLSKQMCDEKTKFYDMLNEFKQKEQKEQNGWFDLLW